MIKAYSSEFRNNAGEVLANLIIGLAEVMPSPVVGMAAGWDHAWAVGNAFAIEVEVKGDADGSLTRWTVTATVRDWTSGPAMTAMETKTASFGFVSE